MSATLPTVSPGLEKEKAFHQHLEHVNSFDDTEKQRPQGRHVPEGDLDEAAKVLADTGKIEYTIEEDKAVLKKIDTWILPVLCLVYWIQQLDKSSVSYAAVFDLRKFNTQWVNAGSTTDETAPRKAKRRISKAKNTAG